MHSSTNLTIQGRNADYVLIIRRVSQHRHSDEEIVSKRCSKRHHGSHAIRRFDMVGDLACVGCCAL